MSDTLNLLQVADIEAEKPEYTFKSENDIKDGRKPQIYYSEELALESFKMYADGHKIKKICKSLKISESCFYQFKKKYSIAYNNIQNGVYDKPTDPFFDEKAFLKEVGERFRWIRELLGYKQNDLARALNLTQKTISRIEQGNMAPSIEICYRLNLFFGISPNFLIFGDKHQLFMFNTLPLRMRNNIDWDFIRHQTQKHIKHSKIIRIERQQKKMRTADKKLPTSAKKLEIIQKMEKEKSTIDAHIAEYERLERKYRTVE